MRPLASVTICGSPPVAPLGPMSVHAAPVRPDRDRNVAVAGGDADRAGADAVAAGGAAQLLPELRGRIGGGGSSEGEDDEGDEHGGDALHVFAPGRSSVVPLQSNGRTTA